MRKLIAKLFSGRKTYVTGGALIGLGVMVAMGQAQLPEEIKDGLTTSLLGGGLVFLRMGLNKLGGNLPDALKEKAEEKLAEEEAKA